MSQPLSKLLNYNISRTTILLSWLAYKNRWFTMQHCSARFVENMCDRGIQIFSIIILEKYCNKYEMRDLYSIVKKDSKSSESGHLATLCCNVPVLYQRGAIELHWRLLATEKKIGDFLLNPQASFKNQFICKEMINLTEK